MNAIYKTITLLIAMLGFAPTNAAAFTTTMNLLPTGSSIQVGDYFDVDVVVNDAFADAPAGEELLGFGFNVQVTGVGEVQFLGSTVSSLFEDISENLGVDAAGLAFPGLDESTLGSTFTLATLHFQVLIADDILLMVVGDVLDPWNTDTGLFFWKQDPLPIHSSLDLTITAVPLPPSALLFFSAGLITLLGRKESL